MPHRHRSSAAPLALAMAALVLYASLYPFTGWRWPPGASAGALLMLPWPPWKDHLDEAFNLVGYLPLGLLVHIAVRRMGGSPGRALVLAVVAPALLSYGTEVVQAFLPGRHPSARDWAMNSAGALLGAGAGAAVHAMGWVDRWSVVRQRWFTHHSAGALALLALWPLALLFPAPVPWGLGQLLPQLREPLAELLANVPWAEEAYFVLLSAPAPEAMGLLAETLVSTLGLMSPVLLAYAVTAPGARRVALAAGALLLAFAATTLATLLNFGPQHALAWSTPSARIAALLAALLAGGLAVLSRRVVIGLALLALAAQIALVSQAPADPYFAQNLQAWEQGRFVRFHGMAEWLGWLWPFLAVAWLLARLGDRE